jgi:hypothetical protein
MNIKDKPDKFNFYFKVDKVVLTLFKLKIIKNEGNRRASQ